MAKRLKIGVIYNYSEEWIGGTYYIDNLVNALNSLTDEKKPIIVAITRPEWFKILKTKTNYPYLKYQVNTGETHLFKKIINTLLYRTIGKRIFSRRIENLDGVFPYNQSEHLDLAKIRAFWIADFQEHFLPQFFSYEEIEMRKTAQRTIAHSHDILVLSSKNAARHFKQIYPSHSVKTYTLPFSVMLQKIGQITNDLLNKYAIPDQFFICSNQFWQHKNHLVVLKALKYLKENYQWEIPVLFTGKIGDYRNANYYPDLLKFSEENNITNLVKFLGFVPRDEQLILMNHAITIVQPSLFEGWSTVIEDGKAMNKMVVASNIEVHLEQLKDSSALFFDPTNYEELAEKLLALHKIPQQKLFGAHQQQDPVKKFATSFIRIFNPNA